MNEWMTERMSLQLNFFSYYLYSFPFLKKNWWIKTTNQFICIFIVWYRTSLIRIRTEEIRTDCGEHVFFFDEWFSRRNSFFFFQDKLSGKWALFCRLYLSILFHIIYIRCAIYKYTRHTINVGSSNSVGISSKLFAKFHCVHKMCVYAHGKAKINI